MKYFAIIIGFTSLVLFNACSSKNEEEIKKVEELSTIIKSLKSTFESINMEEVNHARETYKTNMKNVRLYYSFDTIDVEFADLMNKYKGIKKVGARINDNYETNKENLALLSLQLEKLKIDLTNNVIPKDSVEYFIDFEINNVNKLSDDIGTLISNCDYILEKHKEYAEKVRDYTVAFKKD